MELEQNRAAPRTKGPAAKAKAGEYNADPTWSPEQTSAPHIRASTLSSDQRPPRGRSGLAGQVTRARVARGHRERANRGGGVTPPRSFLPSAVPGNQMTLALR